MESELNIHWLDLRNGTDKEYAGRNAFNNLMRPERFGEETPTPLDEDVRGWRAMPENVVGRYANVWDAAETMVIANASCTYRRQYDNQHVANFDIAVLPSYRQRGIARRVLAALALFAREEGKRLMMAWTTSRVPAGDVFMRRIGAEVGQATRLNQLDLAAVDRDLMRRWAGADNKDAEFGLGLWEGPVPDADLETVCRLLDVMNSMPRDNLDLEDFHVTPEQWRAWEKQMAARGEERWLLYARHVPSGDIAGFTEVFWNPTRPHLLWKGGTGVWPRYRSRGLGRRLKAAMIEKVFAERPQVRFVRTGNAYSNAPMLKINIEMGFKPYHTETLWQVPTDKVFEYLDQTQPVHVGERVAVS